MFEEESTTQDTTTPAGDGEGGWGTFFGSDDSGEATDIETGELEADSTTETANREGNDTTETVGESETEADDPLLEAFAQRETEEAEASEDQPEGEGAEDAVEKSKAFSKRLAEAREKIRQEVQAETEAALADERKELARLREAEAARVAALSRNEAIQEIDEALAIEQADLIALAEYEAGAQAALEALRQARIDKYDAEQINAQAKAAQETAAAERAQAEALRAYSEFRNGQDGSNTNVPILHQTYLSDNPDFTWMDAVEVIHQSLAAQGYTQPFPDMAKAFHRGLDSVYTRGIQEGIARANAQALKSGKAAPSVSPGSGGKPQRATTPVGDTWESFGAEARRYT